MTTQSVRHAVTSLCRAAIAVLVLALSAQTAGAQSASLFEPSTSGAKSKPVNLSRVVFDLSPGQIWGEESGGLLCLSYDKLKWSSGSIESADSQFPGVFKRELRAAGYKSGSDSLFDDSESSAGELIVGARVKSMNAKLCSWAFENGRAMQKGSLEMSIDWQIYSRTRREIVSTIQTSAIFSQKLTSYDKYNSIIVGSFGRNVGSLVDNTEFQKIFSGPSDKDNQSAQPSPPNTTISLQSSATPRPISEASGSVVLVFAGGSLGSAFLVSSDGYLITNAHVVGGEKTVRVRWSDGFESDGEVIRSHKPRDVALIKTNPHGRQPLAMRRGPPTPGTNVFAVGTPLDPKLQGSLTKGIVSANRIIEGFSFIQSDVAVTHGNSGGPLLDEKSTVIGVTDLGIAPDGIPQSINMFIPIGDALDFLNLKTAQ